ncbi:NAD dependent epimerase/dehydratase family protein [Hortaea werneckii]|nr:NAD dependent epimerase/dehydratase family protein [Hortaea werneckii]
MPSRMTMRQRVPRLDLPDQSFMPSALVTGATGILGREIVKELGKDKQTWSTVYALSRSKKEAYAENVKHQHIDLHASAQDMAKELGNIQPEYIFFAAYLAKPDEGDAANTNGAMLENFLEALKITGASQKVKRIILTTGAKQYGVHLGAPKNPMEESDRWLTASDRPPNFYYVQQDILAKKGKEQGWDWVVTYPNDVIGVAKGNFMNLATSIGLYAAVTKEMGQPLIFPGSPEFYTRFDSFTSSRLHAKFNLWAALETNGKVSNQAFNAVNGDVESWQNMWPKLANKFGLTIPERMFTAEEEEGKIDEKAGSIMPLLERPPIDDFAAERGLKGTKAVKQRRVEQKIDLVKWSQRSDVKAAWEKLAKREGLEHEAFEQATWGFLGFVLGRNYDLVINMTKARKAGWTGYQDTFESLEESLEELASEKVLPGFQ